METQKAELCFPNLHNSSCRKPPSNTGAYITQVLVISMSIVITLFNLLVIISIAHFRQLHSATNLILLSLAVSDFLIGLVVTPVFDYIYYYCWYFGDLLCALFYLLSSTVFVASVDTIVLISVDRYLAICNPLRYATKMNGKVVTISISICWMNAFLYAIIVSFDNWVNLGKNKSCQGECTVFFSKEVVLIWAFVTPIAIIIVLYVRVFVVVVSQARATHSHVTAVKRRIAKKSETKATKNLGIVVLVYLLCYCPYYCVAYSDMLYLSLSSPVQTFFFFLLFLNSGLNPLIYAMIYPWFRKTIRLIVTMQILRSGSRDFSIL